MTLIPHPACPACRARISLDALYAAAATSRSGRLLGGPYGLRCPECGTTLRVHDEWLPLVSLLWVAGPVVVLAWLYRDTLATNLRLGAVLLGIPLLLLLQSLYAQRFARLARTAGDENLVLPLEPPPETAPPAEHEVVYTGATTPWHCATCGEENPANFDVCWQCQAPRAAPAAPSRLWFN
jgi:hypothetical protein